MECDNYTARRDVFRNAAGPAPFVWQLVCTRPMRVDSSSGLPGSSPGPVLHLPAPAALPQPVAPFMNEMDEITYWVHTRRAPCLMNYENPVKKRIKSHSSKEPRSVTEETRSPKKKKKRKLSLLDDSVSSDGRQNVYFKTQNKTRQRDNRCKSDSLGSDVDFNIKKTSVQDKSKKPKLQKNRCSKIHKKNKVVTSTPKGTTHLRRSLRHNKGVNHHLNSSFEIFNTSVSNGTHNITAGRPSDRLNQAETLAGGDQTADKQRHHTRNKSRTSAQNGHYEDMSDVSGFTANYIRSTKVQSNKTPRNFRSKTGNNLVKESQTTENESNMVVTMNKSVNTGVPNNVLNCSTDSSQNLIHLVTTKNHDRSVKLDKSTSLLKFVDMKTKGKEKCEDRKGSNNLNISFQSQSSRASRYPKRNKTPVGNSSRTVQSSEHRATEKNCVEFNNSDKKENPGNEMASKTRSGRNICLSLLQREKTVLVVSNSTEPVSSKVSLNVASPKASSSRKKRMPTKQGRNKKVTNKVQSPRRESLRDRSGFAACFSESDDDSEPLIQRKYFCP